MTQQGEAPQGAAARERFCIHYRPQTPGSYFSGTGYVAAIQRLKADVAMRAAGNVEAFFWKDAPGVKVWLPRMRRHAGAQECASNRLTRSIGSPLPAPVSAGTVRNPCANGEPIS